MSKATMRQLPRESSLTRPSTRAAMPIAARLSSLQFLGPNRTAMLFKYAKVCFYERLDILEHCSIFT